MLLSLALTSSVVHFLILFMICIVKNLNNGKAPGEDDIINKYIKSTMNQFLPIHVNLFNLIFSSGIVPDSECMTKRLSCPEYPFLNPPCTPEISPMSSDSMFNLEFRIEVNYFPMLKIRQIAR
jgi:hypothetical protein